MVRLRSFETPDLARLYQLDQVCFSPEIAYSRAQLLYFLTHPRSFCWVVEVRPETGDPVKGSGRAKGASKGILAGFLILQRAERRGRPAGYIVTLDVDPARRRLGLGKLLMQTAEEQMKRDGATVMSLEVAENNTAARQFYRSQGFVAVGTIAKYYGGKIDAEVMEKAI